MERVHLLQARGAVGASRYIWVALAAAASACSPAASTVRRAAAEPPSAAERGYTEPPEVASSVRAADGRVRLEGVAAPDVKIRLASPQGAPVFAVADHAGQWRLTLPSSSAVRLFGLSAPIAGRTVQAQGYVALAPDGECARLRAGSGAVVLGRPSHGAGVLAADFDRKGGVVISGYAPAGAAVAVTIDGRTQAQTKADASGRFRLAPDQPLAAGPHALRIAAGPFEAQAQFSVSAAAPLSAGPYRAARTADGWRIDWLTPGGGIQSTVLLRQERAA